MIGICGFGFVGSAVYSSLKDKGNAYIYDPLKKNKRKFLLDCDYVFVCVPTPLKNGEFDGSYVNETLKYFQDNHYYGIIILKSTCHPRYLEKFPKLHIVSNPEFLKENNAIEDFKNQKTVLLGGDLEYCYKVKNMYEMYFDLNVKKYKMVSFEEALIFKYLRNIKIAYEVMFWEFVESTAGDYKKYQNIMNDIPINVENIRLDGKPGFGGHCLPKDIKSYPKSYLTNYLINFNNSIR